MSPYDVYNETHGGVWLGSNRWKLFLRDGKCLVPDTYICTIDASRNASIETLLYIERNG